MPTDPSAGVLFIPDTMPALGGLTNAEFEMRLMKTMAKAIADPSSAMSTLPFIVRSSAGANVEWDSFVHDF